MKYLKNEWLNNIWNNDELFKNSPSHLLGLGFVFVIQEIERGSQEKHAPQDDDEGAKHEGIAQTQEPPQCWCSVLLLKGVGDLQPGQTHTQWHMTTTTNTTKGKIVLIQNLIFIYLLMLWHTTGCSRPHSVTSAYFITAKPTNDVRRLVFVLK